ncbi:hypothetical protein IJ425_06850 [bacterium]|nr:hypothetical protein [bacterium]
MSDWAKIKDGFIEWLKTQETDFKEDDKDFAPFKYKEKFELYINVEDGDDTTNMDSFTKNVKTEDGKENTDKTLFDSMMDDYINSLQADDKVFAAIDGLVDGKKDGVISNEEKNLFLSKVSAAGFDKNVNDLSFDDIIKSIENIEVGNLDFLKPEEVAPPADDKNNNNDDSGAGGLTTVQQVEKLNETIKTWQPQAVTPTSDLIKTAQINQGLLEMPSSLDLQSLNEQSTAINTEISSAKTDFNSFKGAYDAACAKETEGSTYIATNETQFNEILTALVQNNAIDSETHQQITELQASESVLTVALDTQYSLKDTLLTSLGAIDGSISSLRGQLGQGETEEAKKANDAAIKAQISQLQAEKATIKEQLAQLAQEILENNKLLNEVYENLTTAIGNLATIDKSKANLTSEQSKVFDKVIENQKALTQIRQTKSDARANMTALDSYIQALEIQKAEVQEAIEEANAKANAKAESTTRTEEEEKAIEEAEAAKAKADGITMNYPSDVEGLKQKPKEGETKLASEGEKAGEGELVSTYTLNGQTIKMVRYAYEDADGTISYDYEYIIDDGQTAKTLDFNSEDGITISEVDKDNNTYNLTYNDGAITLNNSTTTKDATTNATMVSDETLSITKEIDEETGNTKVKYEYIANITTTATDGTITESSETSVHTSEINTKDDATGKTVTAETVGESDIITKDKEGNVTSESHEDADSYEIWNKDEFGVMANNVKVKMKNGEIDGITKDNYADFLTKATETLKDKDGTKEEKIDIVLDGKTYTVTATFKDGVWTLTKPTEQ